MSEPSVPPRPSGAPALEALWKQVLDNWEDEKAHAAFLEYCQGADELVFAATRYRGMKGDHARGEAAGKRLQAVAILALAKLEGARSQPQRVESRWKELVLIVFFLVGSGLLLLYALAG
jgi:hypothetical protein